MELLSLNVYGWSAAEQGTKSLGSWEETVVVWGPDGHSGVINNPSGRNQEMLVGLRGSFPLQEASRVQMFSVNRPSKVSFHSGITHLKHWLKLHQRSRSSSQHKLNVNVEYVTILVISSWINSLPGASQTGPFAATFLCLIMIEISYRTLTMN